MVKKKKKKKAAHRPSPTDMGNVSSLLAYLKKNLRTRPALKKGGKQTSSGHISSLRFLSGSSSYHSQCYKINQRDSRG